MHVLLFILLFYSAADLFSFDVVPDKSLNSKIEITGRFSAGGRIFRPSYSEETGKLCVFSEDSRFYIFENSRLTKKIKLNSSPVFSPSEAGDGTFYCCFRDRTLRAYNRGGNLLWLKKLAAVPLFPPVVNTNRNILVFLSDSTVSSYALNGRLRWKKEIKELPDIQPLPCSRGVVFRNSDGYWVITDRGSVSEASELNEYSGFLVLHGELFAYETGERKFLKEENDQDETESLKLSDDSFFSLTLINRRFEPETTFHVKGKPCDIEIFRSNLFILTEKGYFYRFDRNGGLLKEKKVEGSREGRFIILEKYIYLLNFESDIKLYNHDFAFIDRISIPSEAVSGLKSSDRFRNSIPEPVFAGNRTVSVGGNDWILYFLGIEDSELTEEELPVFLPESEEKSFYPIPASLYYIDELSGSERYENREKALSLIEEIIEKGGMSEYEYEILDILYRLGTGGTVSITRNSTEGSSGAIMRSRASQLIFSAGTEISLSMLRKMINAENDEYVIITDIELLGMGGSDPDLETLEVFRTILERTKYELRICRAVVSAAERIASYHGYLPSGYSRLILGMMDIHADKKLKNDIIKLLVGKQ